MNSNQVNSAGKATRVAAYAVGILGTFLIMALLVAALQHYTRTAAVGANRVQERYKNLQDLRLANTKIVEEYAWQDQAKGVVRVPLDRAIELTFQEWQNPAMARSNLIARWDKFNPPPPPPPPPKPSIFE